MGLFSRNVIEDEHFDQIDLPRSSDLKHDPLEQDAAEPDTNATRGKYGIEEAIRLMKSLPRDNADVVVTVVKKTLESTHINVEDIVKDAKTREETIRERHKQLDGEIKQLQEEIARRNQQITELLRDLKDTTTVRQRLQLALELESKAKSSEPGDAKTKSARAITETVAAAQGGKASQSNGNATAQQSA